VAAAPEQIAVGNSVVFQLSRDGSYVRLNANGQFATGGTSAEAVRFVVTEVNAENRTTVRLNGSFIKFNATDVTLNLSDGQPPLTNLWTDGDASSPPLGYGASNSFLVESGGKTWQEGNPITLNTVGSSQFNLEYLDTSRPSRVSSSIH
jgi:hypothetical protein